MKTINGAMTPTQWGYLREMITKVRDIAATNYNVALLVRAQSLLDKTEGYDV